MAGLPSDQRDSRVSRPAPATVKLTSPDGQCMNVTIGSIEGAVSVSNRSTVTHIYGTSNARRKDDSDSDSSSTDSESSSDLEDLPESMRQEFLKCRNIKRDVKHKAKTYTQATNYSHAQGQNAGRINHSTGDTPNSAEQGAASPSFVTKYDRQTRVFGDTLQRVPFPDRIVNQKLIRSLVPRFGQGWRRVFRYLYLPDATIDTVHYDCEHVQDTVYQLLLKWTQQCDKPSIKVLLEALVRGEQNQVVDTLLKFPHAEQEAL